VRVGLLTREYPPEIYGGAGVHVEYLARELRRRVDLSVHCWGAPRAEPGVVAHTAWDALREPLPEAAALGAMSVDLAMTGAARGADVVHSHTWYATLAGHLASLTWDVPHVTTAHSLEPLRPWKAEQLGGGYALSCFCERVGVEGAAAVIAVSEGMRGDVLRCYPSVDERRVHVIHNGIDAGVYRPERDPATLRRYGIDGARPYAVFVGRITRQKGVAHLLRAVRHLGPDAQVVLLAGTPDTPDIAAEVAQLAGEARDRRAGLVMVEGFLPREDVVHVLSGATVFVCPSIYEPFGLVNLEAMACGTAVVASRVGGIPEVVVDGETGYLVDYAADRAGEFERGLARRIDELLADPARAAALGEAGRRRVLDRFSWPVIADRTVDLYERVRAEHRREVS
jgi:starch synthase